MEALDALVRRLAEYERRLGVLERIIPPPVDVPTAESDVQTLLPWTPRFWASGSSLVELTSFTYLTAVHRFIGAGTEKIVVGSIAAVFNNTAPANSQLWITGEPINGLLCIEGRATYFHSGEVEFVRFTKAGTSAPLNEILQFYRLTSIFFPIVPGDSISLDFTLY
jgi:hypothetical protein